MSTAIVIDDAHTLAVIDGMRAQLDAHDRADVLAKALALALVCAQQERGGVVRIGEVSVILRDARNTATLPRV